MAGETAVVYIVGGFDFGNDFGFFVFFEREEGFVSVGGVPETKRPSLAT